MNGFFAASKRKFGVATLIVAWALALGWCLARAEARSSTVDSSNRDQLQFATADPGSVERLRLCAGATCGESKVTIPETIGVQILTILTGGLLFQSKPFKA